LSKSFHVSDLFLDPFDLFLHDLLQHSPWIRPLLWSISV